MAQHQTPPDDPEALREAQNMWVSFTVLTKYSVIVVVVSLLAMALFLL